jgi:predicted tellurium resistance membrane protein TerC
VLIADGFGLHIPKGYVYFAIAFAVVVETLNIHAQARASPGGLHERHGRDDD